MVVRKLKGAESEVLWADQGICESYGISEETTNILGELTAIQKLMQSCQDLEHASLTVRGDCTFAGGASFANCDPASEQLWPLASNTHRAIISIFLSGRDTLSSLLSRH